ncbi:DUF5707 domain-containing protein [Streptomyces sp. SID13726]|uniref:DUF5707 domain-containing protein n=1 Tax=Streptomyces sp. SID13726 TaxID=2706058 RepID=UPI0013BC645B|nr:DUF5707 domain-containing protein [Streptomyces sp. SID13726]NEB00681.1 hypothetical protein [Streptomyces sp. SID13726]
MSKRIVLSSLVAVAAVGGITAGGLAVASAATEPTVEHASARYTAPTGDRDGSLSFTADVSDDSGVRDLKVLAWPLSSQLDPTAEELRDVESAKCVSVSDETARCTYTLTVTKADAAELATGAWQVSVLATGEDGDTVFVGDAARFEVGR